MNVNQRGCRAENGRGFDGRLTSISLTVSFVLLGIMLGFVTPFNAITTWNMGTIFVTSVVIAIVGSVICAVRFDRRKRRLDEHKHWLCRTCEYPLDRLSESGRCPECGTSYTYRELQEYWIQRQARESGEKPNPYREND